MWDLFSIREQNDTFRGSKHKESALKGLQSREATKQKESIPMGFIQEIKTKIDAPYAGVNPSIWLKSNVFITNALILIFLHIEQNMIRLIQSEQLRGKKEGYQRR